MANQATWTASLALSSLHETHRSQATGGPTTTTDHAARGLGAGSREEVADASLPVREPAHEGRVLSSSARG
ncbi:hypothetical protein GCM10009641_83000 [Mycobacterium cookii]|uniref:Secreted protein n=1 Tax=Nocardioides furvisabuli TaxID=375542 RepID=A0ABN2XEQ1_9ACTN